MTELRVGHGIDVHAFAEGRPLVLGGVTIPHSKGLDGHSDADVILHAVMDALLGATGKPDIGVWFPNTDPRWKGAASGDLLAHVWEALSGEGWRLENLDVTVLAEEPKLRPHIPAMIENLANALGSEPGRCNVKATTTERLGFVGRREGMVAAAVVLLSRR